MVIAFIPCAMAANTKEREQGSGWSRSTVWKCASAAEACCLKLPGQQLLSASLHWGCSGSRFGEEQGCSILVSPPRSPPSHSDSHRRTAPSGALPLPDKPGTVTVAGGHPEHAVNPLDGRADSCKYLRNEQMPQVPSKCKGCLSAPHDSVFAR